MGAERMTRAARAARVGMLLAAAGVLTAQPPAGAGIKEIAGARAYQWSLVAVGTGAGLDTWSSWGGREVNPVLGRGQFGGRQAGMKAGVTLAGVGVQSWMVKRHPGLRRLATWMNFGVGVGLGMLAGRNWGVR